MKIGGQIPWNATPICETFKISYLMGRPHLRDVLGNHLMDQSFHLVHWLSITLSLRRTSQEFINLERKSYLDCSSDTLCTRGKFGWHTGCRHWGVGNDGRIWNLLEKTQCERGDISQRKWKIYFSSRRWTNQTFWRRSGTENTHLDTGTPNPRRKSLGFSWRTRRVSSTTSWLISGCRWSLPRHKWPKSWSSMEDPVVLLERNLYGHPLAGLLWERQFEKILLKHGWEKIPNLECLFVHREKGLFLSVYVDDIELAGKKQNLDPMWKVLNKEVDLGEPTSFLDHVHLGFDVAGFSPCTVTLGMYSKTMWNKQRYCWQLQSHVWITNVRGVNWKTTILGKSSYFFVVLRYGRSCQEMCWTILWVGKQDDSTTL